MRRGWAARLDVLGGQHVVGLAGGQLAVGAQRAQRLERQPGAHGVRAVADQRAEVVHLARLGRLHQQAHPRARLPPRTPYNVRPYSQTLPSAALRQARGRARAPRPSAMASCRPLDTGLNWSLSKTARHAAHARIGSARRPRGRRAAHLGGDQVVVHAARRQQRRDGHALRACRRGICVSQPAASCAPFWPLHTYKPRTAVYPSTSTHMPPMPQASGHSSPDALLPDAQIYAGHARRPARKANRERQVAGPAPCTQAGGAAPHPPRGRRAPAARRRRRSRRWPRCRCGRAPPPGRPRPRPRARSRPARPSASRGSPCA